jgi:hypothetical protein
MIYKVFFFHILNPIYSGMWKKNNKYSWNKKGDSLYHHF